jgi:lambda repressor-like predicted transcriptional regulator
VGGRDKDGSFRKPTESAFGKNGPEETLENLALKSNLSVDLLQQAVKLERDYMSRADKLIADWLNLNPEDNESWLAFRDANVTLDMPWSVWRAQALAASGLPDDAKSHNTIPRHFREIEEDKIFNGLVDPNGEDDDRRSYSLGACLKAMGSYFATAGQQRPDVSKENPALHLTLINKLGSFSKTMWANWSEIEAPARMEVITKLTLSITGGTDDKGNTIEPWPEDVRRALAASLKKAASHA